jgi:hypothetical protein
MINLKQKQLDEYKEETDIGIFYFLRGDIGIYNDLPMDLEIKIKAKYGGIKSSHYPLVQCRILRVPLISNGELSHTFNVTRCKNRWQWHRFKVFWWNSRSRS